MSSNAKDWKASESGATVGSFGTLATSTFVSSLGGFLFGYDTIVISGAIGHLSRYYRLDPVSVGWAAACALVGCLVGSAACGLITDRIGLKRSLYCCAFLFALSSLGMLIARGFSEYVVWRIIGGLGIGAASIVAPMYIAEIAPAKVRGRLVVFYQLGIVVGILCSVTVNMLIERSAPEAWQIQYGWRFMFAVAAVPSIGLVFATMACKESPRWLMKVGRQREADEVLCAIHGKVSAGIEVAAIRSSLSEESGKLSELFRQPFRRALLIGFLLAAFSQASGITCLLSFLPEVFKGTGQNQSDAFFQSVLVGLVNLVFTGLAIWLVDKAGRKTLLLAGTSLQTVALVAIAWFYVMSGANRLLLAGMMAFIAGHAFGNGAVCWVIISEIFPTKVRGAAMSIATLAIWLSASLVNQFFPVIRSALGMQVTFAFFAVMAMLNFFFVLFVVPETRGYSLEQISAIWSRERKLKIPAPM